MLWLSVAAFKAGNDITGTSDDAAIGALLEQLSAAAEAAIGTALAKQARTERHRSPDGRHIFVRAYPIDLVQPVTVKVFSDGTTRYTVEASLYRVDGERGFIEAYSPGAFPRTSWHSLEVAYTGGYAEESEGSEEVVQVPEHLRRAIMQQATYEWRNRTTLGATNFSIGSASVGLSPAKWLPTVETILRAERGGRLG